MLAWIPDATAGVLTATRDVDVIPQPVEPERLSRVMDQIDFVLGKASEFEVEHGVYAQAVDDSTVTYAPVGWKNRAIPLRVGQKTALCMDLHDLMLSKYGAGREKDVLCADPRLDCGRFQVIASSARYSGLQGVSW